MFWLGRLLQFAGIVLTGHAMVVGLLGGEAGFRLEMQLFAVGGALFLIGYGLARWGGGPS